MPEPAWCGAGAHKKGARCGQLPKTIAKWCWGRPCVLVQVAADLRGSLGCDQCPLEPFGGLCSSLFFAWPAWLREGSIHPTRTESPRRPHPQFDIPQAPRALSTTSLKGNAATSSTCSHWALSQSARKGLSSTTVGGLGGVPVPRCYRSHKSLIAAESVALGLRNRACGGAPRRRTSWGCAQSSGAGCQGSKALQHEV